MKAKILMLLFFIIAGVMTVIISVNAVTSKEKNYNKYLATARANADNEVPYTACQNYRRAFEIKCEDEEIYLEYLEQSKLLGDSFYKSAVEGYISYFPTSERAYEELCTFYYDTESYIRVLEVANEARNLGVATEKVKTLYLDCFYRFKYVKRGFDFVTTFLGSTALVKKNEKYGFLTTDGKFLIEPRFEDANVFLGSSTAVYDGNEWFMINTSGYKIARPSIEVESLSFLSSGKIVVKKNGKYGYTGASFDIADELPYEEASNFKNGIAAVKVNNKWALINTNEENITDFVFDEVVLDEYRTCINNGVIFVKKDDSYYMVNNTGSKITETSFDAVYPFVSKGMAAVCVDGKWGFVDASGNMVIEPQYEQAKSFGNGLAPVRVGDLWGYISSNGEWRIECQFEDCLPFSTNGIAAVKEDGVWNYIKLLAYYN